MQRVCVRRVDNFHEFSYPDNIYMNEFPKDIEKEFPDEMLGETKQMPNTLILNYSVESPSQQYSLG